VTVDPEFQIHPATVADVPIILSLIKELAEYERLAHEVVATEADLRKALFSPRPVVEALVGRFEGEPIALALFFHSFSTFLGRPGIYLEDLYVRPTYRGRGFGRCLLAHLAGLAVERQCGRLEWSVLTWNELAIKSYRRAEAIPMDDWTVYRLTGDALHRLARESR
jgi:GNAT superfamily N-acetyltransferase